MRVEDVWDQETARSYDTPSSGMFSPEVLGPAVDRLAELAGDGGLLPQRPGAPDARRRPSFRGLPGLGDHVGQGQSKVTEAHWPVSGRGHSMRAEGVAQVGW